METQTTQQQGNLFTNSLLTEIQFISLFIHSNPFKRIKKFLYALYLTCSQYDPVKLKNNFTVAASFIINHSDFVIYPKLCPSVPDLDKFMSIYRQSLKYGDVHQGTYNLPYLTQFLSPPQAGYGIKSCSPQITHVFVFEKLILIMRYDKTKTEPPQIFTLFSEYEEITPQELTAIVSIFPPTFSIPPGTTSPRQRSHILHQCQCFPPPSL